MAENRACSPSVPFTIPRDSVLAVGWRADLAALLMLYGLAEVMLPSRPTPSCVSGTSRTIAALGKRQRTAAGIARRPSAGSKPRKNSWPPRSAPGPSAAAEPHLRPRALSQKAKSGSEWGGVTILLIYPTDDPAGV
jgi:hypothetical protein